MSEFHFVAFEIISKDGVKSRLIIKDEDVVNLFQDPKTRTYHAHFKFMNAPNIEQVTEQSFVRLYELFGGVLS